MKTLIYASSLAFFGVIAFIAGADSQEALINERLQESLHSEAFVIDVNEHDGSILGEPLDGGENGEGVFLDEYVAEELTYGMSLIDGDVIRVYWLKIDAYAEEWDQPVAVTKGEGL